MTRTCIICRHKKRDDIDTDLLGNDTFRNIATRYNVSTGALQRHKRNHLLARLAEVHQVREEAFNQIRKNVADRAKLDIMQADDLYNQVHDLRQRALSLLGQAEMSGDLRTALIGIREARSCIELLAKIEGQIDDKAQLTINMSPEWVELRTLIINALQPYPAAREAVMNALP
jgi:hypothetical protein